MVEYLWAYAHKIRKDDLYVGGFSSGKPKDVNGVPHNIGEVITIMSSKGGEESSNTTKIERGIIKEF